jgi:hypothetical protein
MSDLVVWSSTVQREDDMLVQDLDEELVMAHIERGMYFGLQDVARQIWITLDRPLPVSAICSKLYERYDVDPVTCEREVLGFLNQLAAEGVIRAATG